MSKSDLGNTSEKYPPKLIFVSRLLLIGLTALFGLLELISVEVSISEQGWIYLALMIGLSLPHGGWEHVANLRGRSDSLKLKYLVSYILLIAVSISIFYVNAIAGFIVAIGVTIAKGGTSDVSVLGTFRKDSHLKTRLQKILAGFVRGGSPMIVGTVFHTGIYGMFAFYMTSFFRSGSFNSSWIFESPIPLIIGVFYGVLFLIHLGVGYRRRENDGSWITDAFETTLLVVFFLVVPPLIAVGVYFPFWYATRQISRANHSSQDSFGGLDTSSFASASIQFVKESAAPWIGAIGVTVSVLLITHKNPSTSVQFAAYYSVLVSVIALPHVLVGSWLDRKQGIWNI